MIKQTCRKGKNETLKFKISHFIATGTLKFEISHFIATGTRVKPIFPENKRIENEIVL